MDKVQLAEALKNGAETELFVGINDSNQRGHVDVKKKTFSLKIKVHTSPAQQHDHTNDHKTPQHMYHRAHVQVPMMDVILPKSRRRSQAAPSSPSTGPDPQ